MGAYGGIGAVGDGSPHRSSSLAVVARGPADPAVGLEREEAGVSGKGPNAARDAEQAAAVVPLRTRVARLEQALDVARLGVWRRDLCAGTTEWSPVMFALFGCDPAGDPLSPAEIDAHLTPDSVARRAAAVAAAAPGERFETELEVLALDGVRRWLLQRGEAERDETGAVVALHGTAFDISRRHQAEVALAESEGRFRASLDSLLEGCMLIDRSWRYVYLNDAAARHGHGDRDVLLGRSMLEMYPGVEASEVFSHYRRCMEERVADRFDTSYAFEDGAVEWYEFSVHPVPEGILVLSIDRTAERLTALERENLAARDRLLVEESVDGIFRVEPSGRILDANPAYLAMLGRSEAEVRDHRIQEFFVPGDETPLRLPADADDRPLTVERWVVRPDGRRVLEAVRLRRLPDGTVLASVRDVTVERQRAERQEEAVRLEALGRLAGGVAHDFNNLMTTVLGMASLLLSATPEDDPRRADIEAIQEAGSRAASLTHDLLAFGRGQLLRPAPVDVGLVLNRVARLLGRALRENVHLEVRVADDASVVEVDPAQLEAIATNLVFNAQDAMSNGGTVSIVTARVEVDGEEATAHPEAHPGPYVRLDVTDTGPGIDPEVLPHIFEPFFTTKEFGHGYGLGLATVVGIVGQSGGWVEVGTEAGVGTTFSVFLPAGSEPTPEAGAVVLEAEAHPAAAVETILLVEDEVQVRAVTARVLRGLGYEVMEAGSAAEARALDGATLARVDLLVMDLMLPDASGLALADEIADRRPGLAALFVSGYASPDGLGTRRVGDDTGFLAKPYPRAALAAEVRRLLDARPSRGAP